MPPTPAQIAAPAPVAKPAAAVQPQPAAHKPVVVRQRDDDVRPAQPPGHYVIQIRAIQDKAEAKAFEAELRAHGHAPKLTTYEVPDKGTFYRVRLGPFDSLEAARTAQKQFEAAEHLVTILLAVP